jgi:hypothetical protein
MGTEAAAETAVTTAAMTEEMRVNETMMDVKSEGGTGLG